MANQKLADLIAAARKAGTATASDWESDSGISIEDHRLRSLMNFERDVVQSTADDKDALPQWRAFLEAFDKEAMADCINMDAKRSRRFHAALCLLCDSLDSLESMTKLFPTGGYNLAKGEINPEVAIRGVVKVLDPVTSLLLAMANNEEDRNDSDPGLLTELQEKRHD